MDQTHHNVAAISAAQYWDGKSFAYLWRSYLWHRECADWCAYSSLLPQLSNCVMLQPLFHIRMLSCTASSICMLPQSQHLQSFNDCGVYQASQGLQGLTMHRRCSFRQLVIQSVTSLAMWMFVSHVALSVRTLVLVKTHSAPYTISRHVKSQMSSTQGSIELQDHSWFLATFSSAECKSQ